MSESSFTTIQNHLLVYEGGFSNHPKDPGGRTLNGVTQAVYNAWRKRKGLPTKRLTPAMENDPDWQSERDAIYRQRYWVPVGGPKLAPGVDAAVYDYGVNSGIGRASKVLQRLVGVSVDGVVGAVTIEAANRRNARELSSRICDERLAFLRRLGTFPTFGDGWTRRVQSVLAYSAKLAAGEEVTEQAERSENTSVKGQIPEPKTAERVAKGAAPVAITEEALRDPGGWLFWIMVNPLDALMLLAIIAIGVAFIVYFIRERHKARKDAATPGFTEPVPVEREAVVGDGGE